MNIIMSNRTRDSYPNQDLVSNLPDGVLSNILSCLPTKEAVKTSVLSENWKNNWTSIYNFHIDDDPDGKLEAGKEGNENFCRFVDMVLNRTENSRIKDFFLTCWQKYDSYKLTGWIDEVLRRKVEELDVDYIVSDEIVLPQSLFSCYSLRELHLSLNCIMEIPHDRCFTQLKTLRLRKSDLSDNGVFKIRNVQSSSGRLVLDFPVLEEVMFSNCNWLDVNSLEIKAPKLIRFYTWGMNKGKANGDFVVKLYAANLAEFEASSWSDLIENFVLITPLVHTAKLGHGLQSHKVKINGLRATTILKALPSLKYLRVSTHIVQAFLRATKTELVLPTFGHLKQLEIEMGFIEYDNSKPLLAFLRMAPYLESLTLNVEHCHWRERKSKKVMSLPPCLVNKIKEIKLINFRQTEESVNLAKYFLKNTKELQELLLFVDEKVITDLEAEGIKVLLSEFPTSSSYVSIEVIRIERCLIYNL